MFDENGKVSRRFINICVVSLLAVFAVALFYISGLVPEFLRGAMADKRFMLPMVIVASVVDSINPCAFSVLILTIAFLMSLNKDRATILRMGGVYILGIFLVYILIGLGIIEALQFFGVPNFMAKVGASILVVFGLLNIINDFFPSFPIKVKIPQFAHKKIAYIMEKASLPSSFFLGIMVGLYEFPCTGGPYLMILGLVHDNETFWSGFLYLVLYNLIFVLPLVVILLVSGSKAVLAKVSEWKGAESKNMRFWGGAITIVLGLIIFAL
ncbi:MAG TPA: cytochrome c biogenesis protein CcdA [Candidatus Paceibacterota bacterium]|nr:cytochrome c biogenesis protein CcdA [Candidatus Paceibacterota bacterium]